MKEGMFRMQTTLVRAFALFGILLLGACSTTDTKKEDTTVANQEEGQKGFGLIRYRYTPGELTKLCEAAETRVNTTLAEIGSKPAAERTFANTVLALDTALAELMDATAPLTFMGYVSTDEKLRAEGAACEERIGKLGVAIFTRKDLYLAIKDHKPRAAGEKRLLSETIKKFEKNGLKLPDDKLAVVKQKMQELASLEAQFSANLNNDVTSVEYTAEELKGAPESFISRLAKTPDGSKYIATTKPTDYKIVMEEVRSPEARRRMLFAFFNRAADKNTKLLSEALALRRDTADVLGFATWADYKTFDRMAKDSATVANFLSSLRGKLSERNRKDLAKLAKFKKELFPEAPEAGVIKAWDVNYLANQLKKRDYELDNEMIREYFPAEPTVQGMFEIYAKVLGVNFIEVKSADVWSPDVKLYEIWDAKSSKILAYFYADFYPRPGKYGHAAAFDLISGRMLPTKQYSKPVSAIVSNFSPPAGGKPSMLTHDEVETLFHEFGHIMHQTLTRAPYAGLSGTSVQRDFVEAPSQMLEEWVWQPKLLKRLSGHYTDRAKKLPDNLIRQIIRARDFNQGYFYTRQLYLGLLDLTFHTAQGTLDPIAVNDQIYRDVMGIEPIEGGRFPATFGHLMGGYDAGYYGYLWSEVYAHDMATRFVSGGFLNSTVGAKYRKTVLEQGNMKDAIDLIEEFLGRKPNSKAFFKKLGISQKKD